MGRKKVVRKVVKKATKKRPRNAKKATKKATKKVIPKKRPVKRVTKKAVKKGAKKRGRPKKSSTESQNRLPKWMPEDYVPPKSYKFLGYCTCRSRVMISTKELVSKFVYVCPGCGKRQRTNKLRSDKKSSTECTDKKAWMNDVTSAEYHDMPENEEKVDDIKVIDT